MKEFLEENAEDQRCAWILKKKVKWPIVQFFSRNIRHIFNFWLKTEKRLREYEYRNSLEVGQAVHICEPKHGAMLGEDEVQNEYLMRCLENSFQQNKMILKASTETKESHVFKTNELCVIAGYASDEDKQPLEVSRKKEEDEGFHHKGIEEDMKIGNQEDSGSFQQAIF
jgi:hypothetical protein